MIRFLFGFVLGALVLALAQHQFSLVPAANRGTDAPSVTTPEELDEALVASELANPGESKGSSANYSIDTFTNGTADPDVRAGESESPDQSNGQAGPKLPIELPDTHAGFVDKNVPSLPDEHAKVEAEDVDSSWAEQVEAQIYSFVSTHPNGASIQVVSLVCRTTRCEIAGSVFGESGGRVWNQVLGDMREQPWFASNFADSMFGSGGGFPGEFRFITIIARVGSEIAAPVPQ